EVIAPKDLRPIERALLDPNREMRRRAAIVLERVGYLGRCVADLESQVANERAYARTRVLEMAQAGLAHSVAAFIRHPNAAVRTEIIDIIAALGRPEVGSLLCERSSDGASSVRVAIARA